MLHENSVSGMRGALSAIFTPFDSSNEVNFDALSAIAEYQLSHGLRGFYATGTTGEGLLLSSEERTSVVRHLVKHFGDRAVVVAHVGHPSTDVSVGLAKAAAEVGADWISSVAPIYYGTTYEPIQADSAHCFPAHFVPSRRCKPYRSPILPLNHPFEVPRTHCHLRPLE